MSSVSLEACVFTVSLLYSTDFEVFNKEEFGDMKVKDTQPFQALIASQNA